MKRIYIHIPDNWANGYLRAILPYRHCRAALAKEGIELVASELPNLQEDFDAYVFHRKLPANFIGQLEKWKRAGKRLVYETDDDLYSIPRWNPAHPHFGESEKRLLEGLVELSDKVWVTTPELGESIGKPHKTVVLPNLLDATDYPERQDVSEVPIRILWAGSIHHDKDLEVLVKPVERLIKEYGSLIGFLFWGYLPTGLCEYVRRPGEPMARIKPKSEYGKQVAFVEAVELHRYPLLLSQIAPHIALAPLTDCTFNHSKSNLKALEMGMVEAAFVGSDLPPYQCMEGCGLLAAPDDSDSWYEAIKRLIETPELRRELGKRARVRVQASYTWDCLPAKETWLEAFRELVK